MVLNHFFIPTKYQLLCALSLSKGTYFPILIHRFILGRIVKISGFDKLNHRLNQITHYIPGP
jgi:hypothetical protein